MNSKPEVTPTPDVEWERLVIVTDDGLVRIMPAGDFAKGD